MATRRVIKAVLDSFLGTYVSRNSDYAGYCLFGFLVADLGELSIDLLAPVVGEPQGPRDAAIQMAVARFGEQVSKAGLGRSHVSAARLEIEKLPGIVEGVVNKLPCRGSQVRFRALAVMDTGRRYERERLIFVASHNPGIELRSARVG